MKNCIKEIIERERGCRIHTGVTSAQATKVSMFHVPLTSLALTQSEEGGREREGGEE